MPQLTSPLSTPTGMPATNQAHLGKLAGTRIHFGTFADFTAAITTGTAFYAADLWADGQEMTIASEADSGAIRIWRTSLGHARTVRVGRVDTILPGNSNVVLAAAGQPVGGTGNNGDLSVDRAAGIVYLKTAGAWNSAGNISLISSATATALEVAKAAGSDFKGGATSQASGIRSSKPVFRSQSNIGFNAIAFAMKPLFNYATAGIVTGAVGSATAVLTINTLAIGTGLTGLFKIYADPLYGCGITGPGIPAGTIVSSYGTGNGQSGNSGTYNLVNLNGIDIPSIALDVQATAKIAGAAAYNDQCVYRTAVDSFSHRALFTNCVMNQGSLNTGGNTDTPSVDPIRIYAAFQFVGKDSSNALKIILATFNGQPFLECAANTVVSEWCDDVVYPALAGENVIVHVYITHKDGVSAFQCPTNQASSSGATVGPFGFGTNECLIYSGGDMRRLFSTDATWWTTFKNNATQYKPLAMVSTSWASTTKKSVCVTGDSITAPDQAWISNILQTNNIPFNNLAKSGEAPINIPNNFQARGKAFFGDILVNCLGTNSSGLGYSCLPPLYAQARAAGFKKIIQSTITLNRTTPRLQIPFSDIGTAGPGQLTVTTFSIGSAGTTPIEVGMAIKGTGVNTGTKISAQLSGTTGGAGVYQLVEANGSTYAGSASVSTAQIDTWNSTNLNTQLSDTVTPPMNTAILAAAGTPTGPDVVWDVCSPLVAAGDSSKWGPGLTGDGIHMNAAGTALVVAKAVAENWYLALL